MNFLGFIFSLLLILSFGTLVMLENEWGERRLRSAYLGHVHASRALLSKYESQVYRALPSIPKPSKEKGEGRKGEKSKSAPKIEINPECSRLNLWPLIEGANEPLYAKTLHILHVLYGPLFGGEKGKVALFMREWVSLLKESSEPFHLEKLRLSPPFQKVYYTMLKGCKKWGPAQGIGYPSLLEIVKCEKEPSKICLLHAHPGMCIAIFGQKMGLKVYEKIHEEPACIRTQEWVGLLYAEEHQVMRDSAFLDFMELNQGAHKKKEYVVLTAEDPSTHISLRAKLRHPRF